MFFSSCKQRPGSNSQGLWKNNGTQSYNDNHYDHDESFFAISISSCVGIDLSSDFQQTIVAAIIL